MTSFLLGFAAGALVTALVISWIGARQRRMVVDAPDAPDADGEAMPSDTAPEWIRARRARGWDL